MLRLEYLKVCYSIDNYLYLCCGLLCWSWIYTNLPNALFLAKSTTTSQKSIVLVGQLHTVIQ